MCHGSSSATRASGSARDACATAALFAILLSSGATFGGTVLVPRDQPTIQRAIQAAAHGDIVLVAPGTYAERIDLLGKTLTVRSDVDGDPETYDIATEATILTREMTIDEGETPATQIAGFTFRTNDHNSDGIRCERASPTIRDNIFTTDAAWPSSIYGIRCNWSDAVIVNNVIHGCGAGGIRCFYSSATIVNNTIVANGRGFMKAHGLSCEHSDPAVVNCIIRDNGYEFHGVENDPWLSHCCLDSFPAQGTDAGGNIYDAPLFVDPARGDFHLLPDSPAIDAGTPDGAPDRDIEGNPRECGGGVDIGAYELCPEILGGFACERTDAGGVALSWTLGGAGPESVRILLDGEEIAAIDPHAGRFEVPAPEPGDHVYELIAVVDAAIAERLSCHIYQPFFEGLACSQAGPAIVRLSWERAPACLAIIIERDGEDLDVLPAAATEYTDEPVQAGEHAYTLTAIRLGPPPWPEDRCEVHVHPEAISDLRCEAAGARVVLAWTNGASYDAIEIYRDGDLIETLAGSAEERAICPAPFGFHEYAVRGRLGQSFSPFTSCSVHNDAPRPVTDARWCEIAGDVELTWTNGDCYDRIDLLRDGIRVASLPGSASSYRDKGAAGGGHAYAIAAYVGDVRTEPRRCALCAPIAFVRGDANGDGAHDLADAVRILDLLFSGGRVDCADAADVNDDGRNDIGDPIGLLNYLFADGIAPRAPFPACGADPSDDSLGCDGYPACR